MVLSVCSGMEGFLLPALEWKDFGCLQWNGRFLAAGIGMEGFMLPALEWKGSGYRLWNGMDAWVLAAGTGIDFC